MRIVYLHQYFNTPDMSGGTRSYEIGRRLVAAGHEVELVTSWRETSDRRDWFISDVAGMRVHWLPVAYSNHMSYAARIAAFLRFATGAARYAARLDGDLVFATSTPLTIALPAVYASRRRKRPMIFEVRDLWPELPIAIGALKNPLAKFAARRLEKFAYRNAAHVVALSQGMADGVASTGYPRDRIAVAPNSSDLEMFRRDRESGLAFRRQLGIGDDCMLVGYAGTLGRINDVGYLVRLAAALRDDDRIRFVIVGEGHEKEKVRQLATEAGVLGERLSLVDGVPKSRMPAVLSGIDVATSLFLPLPEMESNSANKFFDALAAGCCIAINYGGWQADLLRRHGAGVVLPREIAGAAETLRGLALDPAQRLSMGTRARGLAENEFSRDAMAGRIEAVLRAALGTDRP